MRKIKRFPINDYGIMLSPNEMRQISGGASSGKRCTVYIEYTDGTNDVYEGTCAHTTVGDYYVAVCRTSVGDWPAMGVCD